MLTRRQFFKVSAAAGTGYFLAAQFGFAERVRAAQSSQIPLAGSAIPQFIDPVPNLLDADHLIVDDGLAPITLEMREHRVNVLPTGAVPGYQGTYVWSYLKPGQATRQLLILVRWCSPRAADPPR